MARRTLVPERIENYVERVIARESEAQKKLREETAGMAHAGMQIGSDQAAFMAILVKSIGAKRALEIGTFTGYSAMAVAAALPADGKLICCDVSEEWTAVAKRHWRAAGLDAKIDLRLAPATDTLARLLDAGEKGKFDFVFIDADKTGYDTYYEQSLELVRAGGLIVLDNMLWGGAVTEPSNDPDTKALQALNLKIKKDARVDATLVTIGDGLVIACKR
jgi:caffeoyl-CoA O-methyltransferase